MRLRPALVAILLIGLAGARAHAQPASEGRVFEGGVRAGAALAQVRGGAFSNVEVGTAASVFGRFALSERFSVQTEVRYVRKGGGGRESDIEDDLAVGTFASAGAVTLGIDEASLDGRVRVDFIEVPLLARYALPTGRTVPVSVYAGPYAAVGVRRAAEAAVKGAFEVRTEAQGTVFAQTFESFQDVSDLVDQFNALAPALGADPVENPLDGSRLFERFDYGLVLGTDVALPFLHERLLLGIRYDLGLRDLLDQESTSVQAAEAFLGRIDDFPGADDLEGRTGTLTLEVGVLF